VAVTGFGKKASQRTSQEDNPNNRDYQFLRLGLSHLTVIRTHILFDHLLSSVEVIIKANCELVNKYFVSEARP
jgi:hypothetical protein